MRRSAWLWMLPALVVLLAIGCSTAPKSRGERIELNDGVRQAIETARATDPDVTRFFNDSAGYAVFPSVGAAAVGVGGAYGQGEVFQNGRLIGYCTMTQANIGFSFGGRKYTEFIFFQTPEALDSFKSGNFAFSGQASAVALLSGVSTNAKYADGVAVFTMGEKGLMVQASLGGQKFSFKRG